MTFSIRLNYLDAQVFVTTKPPIPSATAHSDSGLRLVASQTLDVQVSFLRQLNLYLAQEKISIPQFLLLYHLARCESVTMSAIARHLHQSTASVTGLVDRLEQIGFLKRQHSEKDRRKILVTLTRKGRGVLDKIRSEIIDNLQQILERLDPSDQRACLDMHRKVPSIDPHS